MENLPLASHNHVTMLPSQEQETFLFWTPRDTHQTEKACPSTAHMLPCYGKAGLMLNTAKTRTILTFLKKKRHISE